MSTSYICDENHRDLDDFNDPEWLGDEELWREYGWFIVAWTILASVCLISSFVIMSYGGA